MMLTRSFAMACLVAAGCTPVISTSGESGGISSTDSALSGCHGTASSSIPSSDTYYLTSFGGAGDSGKMSCGESTKSGSWYYMASRQRFGCGAHVKIQANGKCVVAEADDYGPDVCVENAAGKPIIDASPLVSEALFGTSSAGWSDRFKITATVVSDSTPLGKCAATSTTTTTTDTGTSTSSGATCSSYTLGADEPEGACVQSTSDNQWYQCTSQGWVGLYSDGTGPEGACTSSYALGN